MSLKPRVSQTEESRNRIYFAAKGGGRKRGAEKKSVGFVIFL